MATVSLSPIGNGAQFLTVGGLPLNGGFLNTYQAGTTTPQATYTTSAGNVANPTSIPLGVDGRPPNEIWLATNVSYKFVLTDSSGVTVPNGTYDNISGGTNAVDLSSSNGATLIGYGASSLDTLLKNQIQAVVTSLTALRALDKTKYTQATTTGATTQNDGAGSDYSYDSTDTTSVDDALDVIVGTDGGRWKALAKRYLKKQDTAGWALQITKDGSPLDYSSTRAAMVLQQRDTQAGATNALIPGSVFQYNVTGDGNVTAASDLSTTIWQGTYSFMNKSGDGSAHCFTGIGQLNAYGPGGYSELGAFQAELTNMGSAKGTMSGVEVLLKDSSDSGVTSYNTKMFGVIGRIAKYNSSTRKAYCLYASSEGSIAPDGILGGNSQGLAQWKRGIDFQGLTFTLGEAALFPNNTSLAWLTSGGTNKPVIGLNAANEVYIAMASSAASVKLQTDTFADRLKIDGNASDGVMIFVGGSIKRIGQGPADSAGAGFRYLIVPN